MTAKCSMNSHPLAGWTTKIQCESYNSIPFPVVKRPSFLSGPSLVIGPDQSRVTVPGPEATTTRGTSPGQSPDHDQSLGQDPGTKKRRRRKRESE